MPHIRTPTQTDTSSSEAYDVTCDRCGREMVPNELDCEHQERLAVRFRAGYCSEFGDGNLVEGDFCQHCVKDVLGPWLRITVDDPFEPVHRLEGEPKGAFQAYQLKDR